MAGRSARRVLPARTLTFLALVVCSFALLAGCGSDTSSDSTASRQGLAGAPPSAGAGGDTKAPETIGPDIVVAALGDSITAGDPNFDPNPEDRARYGFGTDPQSQYEYWAALDDPRLKFRNCGVFGERTDQIAKRLPSCAKGADLLVIQGGINDIAQSLSGPDSARIGSVIQAGDNIRTMVQEAKKMDIEIALTDVLPWNNGYPYANPLIQLLNEKIDRIGAEEGVPVYPFHDVLEDPQNPELMAEDWTADGDHPSVEGYRRLGELAFRLTPCTAVRDKPGC